MMSLALITFLFLVPETCKARQKININHIFRNFHKLLTHHLFLAMTFNMGFSYSLLISFNTLAPFIIQEHMHYSETTFGHIGFTIGMSFLSGNFLCRYLVGFMEPVRILSYLTPATFIISMINLICITYFTEQFSLIVFGSSLMAFACGIYFPSTNAKAMSLFQDIPGSAVSILSTIVYLTAGLVGYFASLISIHTVLPLFIMYCILNGLCLIILVFYFIKTKGIKHF